MEESETRHWTIGVGCFSLATIVIFLLVYTPAALSASPGASWRPMTPIPLIAAVMGFGGWLPAVVMGTRQLFWKPRVYGWISIGIGLLQFASFQLVQWLLMDSRGITWGT